MVTGKAGMKAPTSRMTANGCKADIGAHHSFTDEILVVTKALPDL
jgi:hypothetical protein